MLKKKIAFFFLNVSAELTVLAEVERLSGQIWGQRLIDMSAGPCPPCAGAERPSS